MHTALQCRTSAAACLPTYHRNTVLDNVTSVPDSTAYAKKTVSPAQAEVAYCCTCRVTGNRMHPSCYLSGCSNRRGAIPFPPCGPLPCNAATLLPPLPFPALRGAVDSPSSDIKLVKGRAGVLGLQLGHAGHGVATP